MKKYIIPEATVIVVPKEDIMTLSVETSNFGLRSTWDSLFENNGMGIE